MANDRERRYRDFASVVYPDSVCTPNNWIDILAEQHIQALISPLHDKDLDENGDPKKAHYHVMLMFEGCKTKKQAIEIFDLIGGVGLEIVKSRRGMARYLCHLDTPHKYQYDINDVNVLGGADFIDIINLPSDNYAILQEILDYITIENILYVQDLYVYVRNEDKQDWFRVLTSNGYIIGCFCSDNRRKKYEGSDKRV